MADTNLEFCELCGEQFDYLTMAGGEKICEYCQEHTCEKCGNETADRLVGDEYHQYCSNCN